MKLGENTPRDCKKKKKLIHNRHNIEGETKGQNMGWCVEWRYICAIGWRTLHKIVIRTTDPNYRGEEGN